MGKCCIPTCRNSRERIPGLTFHQIPSNEPCRTMWMQVLSEHGVEALTEWTLVCGDHFTHEDYKMTARKNFLLPTAVPSVFTVTPCKNMPRKRGRKPKALLQATQPQRVTVLRTVVEDDVRRTGRPRKQKLFTDMLVYRPKAADAPEDADAAALTLPSSGDDDEASDLDGTVPAPDDASALPDLGESSQNAEPNEGGAECSKQPPKNVNVIVFTNQPRPSPGVGDPSEQQPSRPKRRCCQVQTQRLLFYRSVITKLRKRVLSLEACLAQKDREIALLEEQKYAAHSL